MRSWITRWESISRNRAAKADAPPPPRPPREMSGTYVPLHTYLENRYANTVVLSFSQIEDLLGFTLPDLARTDQEWWTVAAASTGKQPYSDAWTLTGRTAKPNLMAQNVVFERAA